MDELKTSSFQLPNSQPVHVNIVRLDDGRIVARTREELKPLPTPPPASDPRRI